MGYCLLYTSDTRSLVTRLYSYGADGMTFASINNGKEYVENTEYSTISKCQLNTLLCLHLIPIYLVVFKGSYSFLRDISS